MKSNTYFSSSKFVDWLRGSVKPASATSEEWNAWRKAAKTKRFRYWLAEDVPDFLQDCLCWPINRLRDVGHYFSNRWVSKTHALTSNLKRGQWYGFDYLMLHALFDGLVDHVEIELASRHIACSEKKERKLFRPHWPSWWARIFRAGWRCPEAGMAHLKWAASLKYDEDWVDKNDPMFGKITDQALAAQQTIVLYAWWKEVRPKRPDPMHESGWSDYCDEKRRAAELLYGKDALWFGSSSDESEDERERSRKIREHCQKLEQEQDDEDTDMLMSLIKIRHSLWT